MAVTIKKEIELWQVAIIALVAWIVIGATAGIVTDVRLSRNLRVACASAGGLLFYVDGYAQCVAITPVKSEVVR